MEKSEWPTENRLQELRSNGVVPYSPAATACAVAAAVALTLLALRSHWQQLWDATFALLTVPRPRFADAVTVLRPAAVLLALPAAAAVGAALLAGLLQTRFLFHLAHARFDLGRLNPFERLAPGALAARLMGGLVKTVLFVAVSLMLCVYSAPPHARAAQCGSGVASALAS